MATSTGSNDHQTRTEMGESTKETRETSPIVEEPPDSQQQSKGTFSKPVVGPWFTFDSVPSDQLLEKMNEFANHVPNVCKFFFYCSCFIFMYGILLNNLLVSYKAVVWYLTE